jgi:hypothetical protein
MHGRLCQVRIRARAKTKGMSRPLRAGRGCRFGFCVYIAGERWVLASAQAAGEHGSVAGDYEYIDSFACYGEFGNGVFDRMAESRREVWFGDDGSGLIRSQHIRSVFFTDEQRLRWETMPHRSAREAIQPSLDLFAAGCFHGPRRELAQLPTDRTALTHHLRSQRQLTLHAIHQLLGEALVPSQLRQALFDLAADLPDAWISEDANDQLGRAGIGIARVERAYRVELIFDRETQELLGYRQILIGPDAQYAPTGAITGWTSYVERQVVDALPPSTPPVPEPPCDPPGGGRGTAIRPGFTLGTGYFSELQPHLDQWLTAGVITETDHKALQRQGPN